MTFSLFSKLTKNNQNPLLFVITQVLINREPKAFNEDICASDSIILNHNDKRIHDEIMAQNELLARQSHEIYEKNPEHEQLFIK